MSLSTQDMAIARRMLGLYEEAERRMLERVEKRLAKGITQVGWNERKLLETQLMRRELEQEIARLSAATTKQAHSMLSLSYWRSAKRVDVALGGALATRTPSQAMLALERSLASGLQGTHVAILRQFDDVYRDVVARAAAEGVAGVEARRGVARSILRDFQRRGVSGFVDRSGRRWNLRSYANMASRTAVAQAHVQGSIDRLMAHNIRLGRIPQAWEAACALCSPWVGKVVTLSGRDPRYPSVEDARSAGLFHPNCRHGVVAYIPELEEDEATPAPQQTATPARAPQRARPAGQPGIMPGPDPSLQTAREAELYLRKQLGVKSIYLKGMSGDGARQVAFGMWEATRHIKPELVKRIMSQIQTVAKAPSDKMSANAWWNLNSRTMTFPNPVWNDPEFVRRSIGGIKTGWHAGTAEDAAYWAAKRTAVHEFGHGVGYAMRSPSGDFLVSRQHGMAYKEWLLQQQIKRHTSKPSTYAGRSLEELEAELYAGIHTVRPEQWSTMLHEFDRFVDALRRTPKYEKDAWKSVKGVSATVIKLS